MSVLPELALSHAERDALRRHLAPFLRAAPDLYFSVLQACLAASPTLNDIISRQKYHINEPSKLLRFEAITRSQAEFTLALVYSDGLEHAPMRTRIGRLRRIHLQYLKYGFKPHFLDLWLRQMEAPLARLVPAHVEPCDAAIFLRAFCAFNQFIVETLQLEADAT